VCVRLVAFAFDQRLRSDISLSLSDRFLNAGYTHLQYQDTTKAVSNEYDRPSFLYNTLSVHVVQRLHWTPNLNRAPGVFNILDKKPLVIQQPIFGFTLPDKTAIVTVCHDPDVLDIVR
jgi:hypothetical protein